MSTTNNLPMLGLILGLSACGDDGMGHTDSDAATAVVHWALGDEFLAVAHRGGAGHAPENTIEAITTAATKGARIVEVDLWRTTDGEIVVLHDNDVSRTTDGQGDVQELSLAELQAFDAGATWSEDGTTFPFAGQGIVVPRLADALAAGPDLYWLLEIKQADPPITDDVVAIVEAAGMAERVFFFSFDTPTLKAIRTDHPSYVTAMSEAEYLAFGAVTDETEANYTPPAPLAMIAFFHMSQFDGLVERADRLGVKILLWTVNDATSLDNWLDDGVHGIISDQVDLLQGAVAERGLSQP